MTAATVSLLAQSAMHVGGLIGGVIVFATLAQELWTVWKKGQGLAG